MFESIDRSTETEIRESVSADELEAHTDAFVGLERYPGTDDQWEAAEYIVEKMDEYGVDAEIETMEGYVSVPESAGVEVTTPKARELDAITTAFSPSTPAGCVGGEVVHVEDLSTVPERDVAGKVVFTRGLPTPGAVRPLDGSGAEAVVFESPTEGHVHEMIVSPIWGTPSVDDYDELPDVPVVEVYPEGGEWLREMLAMGPVELTVETQTTTELRELPCPIARIDGTESDRYFVVGNHIDSWYEGVTDNGTAIAATMELARLFEEHPPKRGLVFGFWPGHSMGRYAGSAWWADENWLDLRENGVAYLHIDLNGLQGADRIWYQHMAEVADEHVDALSHASLPVGDDSSEENLLGSSDRPGRSSDQSFWGAGLSSLLSGARFEPGTEEGGPVGGGWWWHTPEDTRDKVDLDLLVEETELYVNIASRVCNSPVLPRDFSATAEDVRTTLEGIEDASDGAVDFSAVHDRIDDLDDALARLNDRLDDADEFDHGLEDAQVELGNVLIPALYMEREEYAHEPALPHDLLPYLRVAEELPERTGRDRRFAETKATRGANKIAHRVDEAVRAAERALEE